MKKTLQDIAFPDRGGGLYVVLQEILVELRAIRKLQSKLVYCEAERQRNPRRSEPMKRQLALALQFWREDPAHNAKQAAARAFRQVKGGYSTLDVLRMVLTRELQKR